MLIANHCRRIYLHVVLLPMQASGRAEEANKIGKKTQTADGRAIVAMTGAHQRILLELRRTDYDKNGEIAVICWST